MTHDIDLADYVIDAGVALAGPRRHLELSSTLVVRVIEIARSNVDTYR